MKVRDSVIISSFLSLRNYTYSTSIFHSPYANLLKFLRISDSGMAMKDFALCAIRILEQLRC